MQLFLQVDDLFVKNQGMPTVIGQEMTFLEDQDVALCEEPAMIIRKGLKNAIGLSSSKSIHASLPIMAECAEGLIEDWHMSQFVDETPGRQLSGLPLVEYRQEPLLFP